MLFKDKFGSDRIEWKTMKISLLTIDNVQGIYKGPNVKISVWDVKETNDPCQSRITVLFCIKERNERDTKWVF